MLLADKQVHPISITSRLARHCAEKKIASSSIITTMAIYSAVPPPPESPAPSQSTANIIYPSTPASGTAIDIEAWTISALQSLSVSPIARGTGSPLSIPLDALAGPSKRSASRQQVTIATSSEEVQVTVVSPPRRPPSARDSQKRREALLKGKEGSRQRRRWENGIEPLLPLPDMSLCSKSCHDARVR